MKRNNFEPMCYHKFIEYFHTKGCILEQSKKTKQSIVIYSDENKMYPLVLKINKSFDGFQLGIIFEDNFFKHKNYNINDVFDYCKKYKCRQNQKRVRYEELFKHTLFPSHC